jgi:hypothetical protein
MSYDLNFWRYRDEGAPRTDADHYAIYERLCDGEISIADLEDLPVAAVRRRIAEALRDWTLESEYCCDNGDIQIFWCRGAGPDASIEALFSPKWARFDLRGRWTGDDANLLIDILNGFGCPLYDPQEKEHGQRFILPAETVTSDG